MSATSPQRRRPETTAPSRSSQDASSRTTLQTLTSAALLLPGLVLPPTAGIAADENSAGIQYSRYQEGERNLIDVSSDLEPMAIDMMRVNGNLTLGEQLNLSFHLAQDTWSGATPVTTAPLAAHGNRAILENVAGEVVTVGASPYVNGQVLLNRDRNPAIRGADGEVIEDPRNVLVMSSASPEARDQFDLDLSYAFDTSTLNFGAGISSENDYRSRYGNVSISTDFNQQLSTLTVGAGYGANRTRAILDDDLVPYLTRSAYAAQIDQREGSDLLHGHSHDWNAGLSLTQVLNRSALLELDLGYDYSSGFLENPYKAMTVIFTDRNTDLVIGDVRALLEQRPDSRRQYAFSGKLVQYIAPLDAALHLEYRYSSDDWGIRAHSLALDWVQPMGSGWTLTPRLRYYTQSGADFYRHWLVSSQPYRRLVTDSRGREIWFDPNSPDRQFFRDRNGSYTDANDIAVDPALYDLQPSLAFFDPALLPDHFSSDHRLSGFGSVSGGIVINKRLTPRLSLETGLDYYRRAGALESGGDTDSGFADFDYWMLNAALKLDIGSDTGTAGMAMEGGRHSHQAHPVPAGVMFGHMLTTPGSLMTGYHYRYSRRGGEMLAGTAIADDGDIVNTGRGAVACRFVPLYMDMQMHMFDILYAPNAWLNLMVMPQFMEMEMDLRDLVGRPPPQPGVHEHTGLAGHTTGAAGDTVFGALFGLFSNDSHRVLAALAVSAPTGKTDIELRRTFKADGGLAHFGMQTGSGTWDLLPSLTYTGTGGNVYWGTQLSATKRLESDNGLGYRLGNGFQVDGWTGYHLSGWLSASLRASYMERKAVAGALNAYSARLGPMDFPANQGGRYWDLGFSLNLSIPGGRFAGNSVALEWQLPVKDDVNGYQLAREGALSVNWQLAL